MTDPCIRCGSYAINPHCHGRNGSDGHLCDACYWRERAETSLPNIQYADAMERIADQEADLQAMETLLREQHQAICACAEGRGFKNHQVIAAKKAREFTNRSAGQKAG